MAKKKKEQEITTVEWSEPNLVTSEALLRKENEKLKEEVASLSERLDRTIKTQIKNNDQMVGAIMRQQECIKLLVSYLDAPVKARSKLADIERMLK